MTVGHGFHGVHARERHQHLRRLLPAFHVRQKIGAAGDQHGVRSFAGKDACRLGDRARRLVTEPREAHHGVTTSFGCLARAPGVTALPSPPSHGGGTIIGSGYGTSGKYSGPTPGFSPPTLRSSPLPSF